MMRRSSSSGSSFDIGTGGQFLSPRNLWNLSVQTATVAVMATGMVLIIVSRNIDLSVGSMLGVIGMFMALLQAEWIPPSWASASTSWWIWIVTVIVRRSILGALIGGLQGFLIAYVGIPSFVVTLGGLLVWRAVTFIARPGTHDLAARRDLHAPRWRPQGCGRRHGQLDHRHRACASRSSTALISNRRRRRRFGFPVRPLVGGGAHRRRRLRRRAVARCGSPTATRGPSASRRQYAHGARHHRAAGRPHHPDRHRQPGAHRPGRGGAS